MICCFRYEIYGMFSFFKGNKIYRSSDIRSAGVSRKFFCGGLEKLILKVRRNRMKIELILNKKQFSYLVKSPMK